MTDQLDALQSIINDVDQILRERLAEIGARVAHIMLAIDAEGSAIVRGNVEAPELKEMGFELVSLAEEAMERRPDNEPLN